jgi:hypothetical protein
MLTFVDLYRVFYINSGFGHIVKYVEFPCYLRRTEASAQMYSTLLLLGTTVTKYNN